MRMAALLTLLVALPALAADKAPAAPAAPAAGKTIEIKVTDAGFVPKEIRVKKGVPVTLSFLRTTDRTCIKAVDIPDEKVKNFQLPLDKAVSLTIARQGRRGALPLHRHGHGGREDHRGMTAAPSGAAMLSVGRGAGRDGEKHGSEKGAGIAPGALRASSCSSGRLSGR